MWQQPQQPQQQPPPHQQQPGGGAPGGWQQQPQGGHTAQIPGHFGPVTDDERTWSLMAYVGQFLVSAIAPAIVYVGKARSPFARKHAVQGLNMSLASIAVWFVFGLLSLAIEVLIWVPLLFTAVVMFFLVYAGRAANRGEFRRVPSAVAWPLLKK
ncbi:DUF4870 domain-containing protein [Actinomadura sp. KC216]|uniref:DUF4870 domain-containing protein n=1 Tax=Actinomadura sp. KC216 TaxID=2530370 RepID=UPI0010517563|nr:DUF4870 domain-containing protein [Actinomadura sp. KC216]TDB85376.1 DUF4870 domain-containing protein [Actinomadura sp. KC216]